MGDVVDVQSLSDAESKVLREVLEVAYREQHREVFELKASGNPKYMPSAEERLRMLERLLKRCGSSVEAAMRPVRR